MNAPAKIHPPWSPSQVDALQTFQRAGFVHPFTCPNQHAGASRDLVATVDGWICPHCEYRQRWAYASMLGAPVDPGAELRAALALTRVADAIEESFPTIDFKAPSAKVMLERAAKMIVLNAFRQGDA